MEESPEDSEEPCCSSAIVVDKMDLQGIYEEEGEEDPEVPEQQPSSSASLQSLTSTSAPYPKSQKKGKGKKGRPSSPCASVLSVASSSSSARKRRSKTLPELRAIRSGSQGEGPSTSRWRSVSLEEAADPEDEIRKATTLYLSGAMSATDFALRMEEYERLKARLEEEERARAPSLVLLNPDLVSSRSGSREMDEAEQERLRPEVILMEGEEDEGGAKLRGEFFRTGDDMATFTVRKRRKMPPTIKSMMGEAHVRFARGDLQGAESICLEVIKEQPTYKDPFHTLAMIYENQGRGKKALQFFLISGLLDPKNFEDWPRLAEMSAEDGNLQQGIMCLSKALACDPTNLKALMRRSELLTEAGDYRGALRGYHKVLTLSERDPDMYMDVVKKIAGVHFKCGELEQAYDVLLGSFEKFPDYVTTTEMNLLAEVCISLKRYTKAMYLFIKYSGVKFNPVIPKSAFKDQTSLTAAINDLTRRCLIPIGLHADLVQKLCIVFIHLEAYDLVTPNIARFQEAEMLDVFGPQLYEIAEAYLEKQQYESARSILVVLLNSEKYSQAAEIWLRLAECLFLMNRFEESAEAYSTVIKLAPGHKVARLNLSVILQKLGRFDVALQNIDQHEVQDLMDQDLLVEKCNILFARNRMPEFFETAMQLFSKHCPDIRNLDEAHALVITSQTNQMLQAIRSLRIRKGDPLIDDDLQRIDLNPTGSGIGDWTVYLNLYKYLLKTHRTDLLCRLAYTVWSSPLFGNDERMKRDLDFHATYASVLNSDSELSPLHIRSLISTFGLSTTVLKLINLACRRCGHYRHGRQLIRMLARNPTDTRVMMLSANISFMNNGYKYALMEYFAVLQQRPDDPLVHLMIASTYLHICQQKTVTNRAQLTAQAIAFTHKYAELRGECQEAFYNVGRMYQSIGLYSQALMYYKRVLITEPLEDVSYPDYNMSDLKREAAFNIALIYRASNCWQLAKRYIYRYCIV